MISRTFFFNDTATTEIYTLSLHDALPISRRGRSALVRSPVAPLPGLPGAPAGGRGRHPRSQSEEGRTGHRARVDRRSEEHTSELQSRQYLVCRLLLE